MYGMSAPGRDHFWPQDYNLINLSRGLLGEAMYQISKALALWFHKSSFFEGFLCISLC